MLHQRQHCIEGGCGTPGEPLTQIVTTNGAALVMVGDLFPTLDASPMRATCRNVAVHGAVPDIWLLVTDWALLCSVQIPEALPFLSILFTKLRSDEGTFVAKHHYSVARESDV